MRRLYKDKTLIPKIIPKGIKSKTKQQKTCVTVNMCTKLNDMEISLKD